jgi:hypothetical protein
VSESIIVTVVVPEDVARLVEARPNELRALFRAELDRHMREWAAKEVARRYPDSENPADPPGEGSGAQGRQDRCA